MSITEPILGNLDLENSSLKTPETEQADSLIRELVKLRNYGDIPVSIVTQSQNEGLAKKMENFADSLPEVKAPQTPQEVVSSEMRRRLKAEAKILLSRISPEAETWQEIVGILGISEQDLAGIEIWLKNHLEEVRETNNRLLQSAENLSPRKNVDFGIEELRYRAQNAVGRHLEVLKDILTDNFSDSPGVTRFLERYLIATNINRERASIDWDTHVLSIAVKTCTRIYQNEIYVIPEAIIEQIGHEGLGHGRHSVVMEDATFLPEFLRRDTGSGKFSATIAAEESIARYFAKTFFVYLKNHPAAATQLQFSESFDKIYQRYTDNRLLSDYWLNLSNFGRLLLAKNGKPDIKNGIPQNEASRAMMEAFSLYSLDPKTPGWFIKNRENQWDTVTGRLLVGEVAELRYATNIVQRIMEKATPEQVPEIEKLILTGLWTPEGLEQWVKVNLDSSTFQTNPPPEPA